MLDNGCILFTLFCSILQIIIGVNFIMKYKIENKTKSCSKNYFR